MTTELHVLRVFTAKDGQHGNPLGVFVRGMEVPEASCLLDEVRAYR